MPGLASKQVPNVQPIKSTGIILPSDDLHSFGHNGSGAQPGDVIRSAKKKNGVVCAYTSLDHCTSSGSSKTRPPALKQFRSHVPARPVRLVFFPGVSRPSSDIMDNEVPLPPPRRIRHRSPTKTPVASGSSLRKTYQLSRFDDRSSQPSSDPALFSSDDIPASGLENYHAPVPSGSRKRRYRGTWWGEMVKDPKRKRADFKEKRHVDSGVWMGSDESGAESLLPSEDPSMWGEELLKDTSNAAGTGSGADVAMRDGGRWTAQSQRSGLKKVEEPKEHQAARNIVNECLESGQDSVDLRCVCISTTTVFSPG